MFKLKLVTNDDIMVVTRSREKKTESFWTTAMDLLYQSGSFSVPQDDDDDNDDLASVEEPERTVDAISFYDLAQMSPSKPQNRPTARTIKEKRNERVCRKCGIEFESEEDITINSPWIGCDGIQENLECTYWIHACCKGFTNASDSSFETLNWYCDDHNPSIPLIQKLKEKKKEIQKRKKRR